MKKIFLFLLVIMWAIPAYSVQQTITSGAGTEHQWSVQKGRINNNFTELYLQAATHWVSDGHTYTADIDTVTHGGKIYICTTTHNSSAAGVAGNEPGVGGNWLDVWKPIDASGLGLGTTDNVTFGNVSASGGTLSAGVANITQGALILYSNTDPIYSFGLTPAASPTAIVSLKAPPAMPGGSNYLLNFDADGTGGWTDPASIGGGSSTLGALTDVSGEGTTDYMLYDDGDGTFSFRAAPSGSMTWPSTVGIVGWTSGTTWDHYALDTDLSSVSASDDSIPSAKAADAAYQKKSDVVEGAVGTGLTGTLADGVYTISVTPNTYQPYDTTLINKAAIDTQNKFEDLLGWTIPASGTGFSISETVPTTSGQMVLKDSTHHLYITSTTGIIDWDLSSAFTAWDTTPTAFSFTDQTDVALNSTMTSDAITVAGINYPAAISVSGGTYDINASDSFTSSAGTVSVGDTVRARHTSSASNSTAVDTIVTIGGVSDTFSSTTLAAATTYDLTMAITDTTGTGSTFTVDGTSATVADTPKTWTGLSSATESVTFTPNSTETSSCTGTGVTGSDPNWVVDMSGADVTDMACTVSAASGGAEADYIWEFDDNAASYTMIESATGGGTFNGSFTGTNTSVVSTDTGCLDGRCFDYSIGGLSATVRPTIHWLNTDYSDGTFSIQTAFKIPSTATITSGTRVIASTAGLDILVTLQSSTAITVYYGGTNLGNITIGEVKTDAWTVLRLVFDTGISDKVKAYRGTTESGMSLVGTPLTTAFGTTFTSGTINCDVYGNSTASQNFVQYLGKVDQIKVWKDAVAP